MTRIALSGAALMALLTPAFAEDGCDKFAWPLTREQALLAAPGKPEVKSGETLAAAPGTALKLALQPGADASFVIPPERKPKAAQWFGGAIRLPAPGKPGVYQVTLSEEAWLDIVQDGHYVASVAHSGRGDCPGLRKSVRFDLKAAPFALQVSGVAADTIFVTIGPGD